MLKWTVNKRPDSSGQDALAIVLNQSNGKGGLHGRRSIGTLQRPHRNRDHRHELRRKSLGSSEITKRISNRDKENQHIATPHPYNFRANATSTPSHLSKFDFALRDVGNLTPSNTATPNATLTPSRKRPLPKTPPSSPAKRTPEKKALICPTPALYASTLPTFDIEYSPCGAALRAGPVMPIRSVTETYFNNQRYFQDEEECMPAPPVSKRPKLSPPGVTPLSTRLSELRFSKISFKRTSQRSKKASKSKNDNNNSNCNNNNNHGGVVPEESLSSSAMDDTALERMIDAILESAKKEKTSFVRSITSRKSNTSNQGYHANFGSPTYTAAEDPASDVNLFCDNYVISPQKVNYPTCERTIIIQDMEVINEREVRTPEPLPDKQLNAIDAAKPSQGLNEGSCHLRRQRAVRRKNIKTDLVPIEKRQRLPSDSKSSESKSEDKSDDASPQTTLDENLDFNSFFKKNIDELACMNTPTATTENDADATINSNNLPQCAITSITSKISYESTPGIHSNDLQASSTPTGAQAASIRRCLKFSDSPPDSIEGDSLEKRKSTASSTVSSTSSQCFRESTTGNHDPSLDLSIFMENNELNIHGELV